MKILLAKTAGFCMGVKRAMHLALKTAQGNKKVYTCGPLIHNPQAVDYLHKNGVSSISDYKNISDVTLVIRAHGMPKQTIDKLKMSNIDLVDATCPHVLTSQKQIESYANKGWLIVIIGDKKHPEILSLQSFAGKNHIVISSISEIANISLSSPAMVIAQTTFSMQEYSKIASLIKEKVEEVKVCNSICKATSERQAEIRELSAKADAVIIVGGRESANTKRLAEISSQICPRSYHIETDTELQNINFNGIETIAVTAGASTPEFIMKKVLDYLRKI